MKRCLRLILMTQSRGKVGVRRDLFSPDGGLTHCEGGQGAAVSLQMDVGCSDASSGPGLPLSWGFQTAALEGGAHQDVEQLHHPHPFYWLASRHSHQEHGKASTIFTWLTKLHRDFSSVCTLQQLGSLKARPGITWWLWSFFHPSLLHLFLGGLLNLRPWGKSR